MKIILTEHVQARLLRRKIQKQELLDTIKFPDKIIKKHGKHYFQKNLGRGRIESPCIKTERNIKILTVYWL